MLLDKSTEGSSKLLTRRWHEESMERHLRKIAFAKPTLSINNICPKQKLNKTKGDIMQEERFTEIERENRILFEKLSKIRQNGNGGTQRQ